MMATQKPQRDLPSKEAAIFKSILKFYEHKQYKKGLKAADSILKKFPNHGETLAMKGLFCNNLDRKPEAIEYIKKGLMNDMTSHICWHVYGLFHRSEQNYEEALKCYSHALKYDKENNQIMRDYSVLQIQIRHYEQFNEMRHQLLALRPTQRNNWVALAVSYEFLGKYDMAERVMSAYEDSVADDSSTSSPMSNYESSQLITYKNRLIQLAGDFDRALSHVDANRSKIVSIKQYRELRAACLLKLNRLPEAEVEYMRLLTENPDDLAYINGLRTARGLEGDAGSMDQTTTERLIRLFNELGKKFPRSHIIKTVPFMYASGSVFRDMMHAYLVPMIRKGTPALCSSLKSVLTDSEKAKTIESLVLGYYESLKTHGRFEAPAGDSSEIKKEPPTSILWTMYFLAQFYDRQGNLSRALELIDEAIAHSPTVVELVMARARILKHCGDAHNAMLWMNRARILDLQDRYVNTKCAKYMLRANNTCDADRVMILFTRAESPNPTKDFIDMQNVWYATETGRTYYRMGQYGKSLKYVFRVQQFYREFYDDQLEFHAYAIRRCTVTEYVDLILSMNSIYEHDGYLDAVVVGIRCYIDLFDKIHLGGSGSTQGSADDLDGLSASERKKMLRKMRKAELKNSSEVSVGGSVDDGQSVLASSALVNVPVMAKKKAPQTPTPADADPSGKQFVENVDFLAKAHSEFVTKLNGAVVRRIDVMCALFDVLVRMRRFGDAMKWLVRICKTDVGGIAAHERIVRMCVEVVSAAESVDSAADQLKQLSVSGNPSARIAAPHKSSEIVVRIVTKRLCALIGFAEKDALSVDMIYNFNFKFAQTNADCGLPHPLAAAECASIVRRFLGGGESASKCAEFVSAALANPKCASGVKNINVALECVAKLNKFVAKEVAANVVSELRNKFPLASVF